MSQIKMIFIIITSVMIGLIPTLIIISIDSCKGKTESFEEINLDADYWNNSSAVFNEMRGVKND